MTGPDGHGHRDADPSGSADSRQLITPTDDEVRQFAQSAIGAKVSRRTALRVGAAGTAAACLTAAGAFGEPALAQKGLLSGNGVFAAAATAVCRSGLHRGLPDQPADPHAVHGPAADPEGAARRCRSRSTLGWAKPPGPGDGQQNSLGNERHQIWPSQLGYPDPIVYKIDLLVAHALLHHLAGAADRHERQARRCRSTPPASPYPAGTKRTLPPSTIYGFNGTFPGPMINAEYGKPVLVRFENHLDENPWAWTGRTSAPRTGRS